MRHVDASDAHASARRLTLLVYLNEQWSDTDGGELQLFIDREAVDAIELEHDSLATVVDAADDEQAALYHVVRVPPRFGTAAMFMSHGVPHEVLPSNAETRDALTFWLYDDADEDEQVMDE